MKQQCQGVQWNYKPCFYSVLNMTADITNSIWKSIYIKWPTGKLQGMHDTPVHVAMPLFAS